MRAFFVGVAGLLMMAHPSAASLYRCEASGVVDPLSTGSLSQPSPASKILFDAGFGLTFDAVSGLLRTGVRQRTQNEPSKFSVISPGNNQNDLVALYQSACVASCPLAFLKIRVWQPSMPFLYVDVTGSVWSGTCTRG